MSRRETILFIAMLCLATYWIVAPLISYLMEVQ